MYKRIVRQNLLNSFKALNNGDFQFVTKQFGPNATHWFSGENHPLAGLRTTNKDILSWYDRLHRLMPDLKFEIEKISVSGLPHNTIAFLEWKDTLTDREGKLYSNRGVHVIGISWGKVVSLEVFCDTEYLNGYFEALKKQGVEEAFAEPIVSK